MFECLNVFIHTFYFFVSFFQHGVV